MGVVVSRDGTSIAYDRRGSGPAVILVGGGLDDGSENAPLAAALAGRFTTYNYARRGRGGSGDTQPYDVVREIEDIDALITEAGGRAHLFGVSSGGMFALEAAAAGLAAARVAVYDVPYDTASDATQRYDQYREELGAALAEGRRGDAVALFMRVAGSSEEEISGARTSPYWPGAEALAHTLAYDAALYGPPPAGRLAAISQPVLVATGEATSAHRVGEPSDHFFAAAADAVAAGIPNANLVTLPGQGHVVDPDVMAPVLDRFFRVDG
ncbi:MAG: alpha/beta hydrolase [Nocardiopsaceae bacterium]|jgi:pimeloyl-ACP methyl ester carboxylesterase|nr:alpha/beta hydrolase [Nocardiopsaceae bacterium]